MKDQYIWLIGGTSESITLAQTLVAQAIPTLVTVTTETAKRRYPDSANLQIQVGCLRNLDAFLKEYRVAAVLDASHPFATEISQQAIAATAQASIPYLRYERPTVNQTGQSAPNEFDPAQAEISSSTRTFASIPALLASGLLVGQRALLTLGYRTLDLFTPWHPQATLFARILPSMTALEAAIAAGFPPERIIALRPPFSQELERALWQHWQISMVVTKASGSPGGEDIKRQLAAELGISLVAIARPAIAYPQQTSDLAIAIQFCQQHQR